MKTAFLIVSLLCLMSASAYALDPYQTIYGCGFENPPFVANAAVNGVDGWVSNSTTLVKVMAEPAPATNQFLYIGKPSSTNTTHTFQTVSGKERLLFSYDWAMNSYESNSNVDAQGLWMMITGADGGRSGIISANWDVTTGTGWFRAWNAGPGWTKFGSLQLGTKYNLAMDLDFATKTYDVYLNGQQMLSGLKFYTSTLSSVNTVYLYKRYACGDYAIDNINVMATPEPSGLLALGCGVVGIAGLIRRKR